MIAAEKSYKGKEWVRAAEMPQELREAWAATAVKMKRKQLCSDSPKMPQRISLSPTVANLQMVYLPRAQLQSTISVTSSRWLNQLEVGESSLLCLPISTSSRTRTESVNTPSRRRGQLFWSGLMTLTETLKAE